jgi:hypothetical protein
MPLIHPEIGMYSLWLRLASPRRLARSNSCRNQQAADHIHRIALHSDKKYRHVTMGSFILFFIFAGEWFHSSASVTLRISVAVLLYADLATRCEGDGTGNGRPLC